MAFKIIILMILLNASATYGTSFQDFITFSGPKNISVYIIFTKLTAIPALGFVEHPQIQVSISKRFRQCVYFIIS